MGERGSVRESRGGREREYRVGETLIVGDGERD